MSARAISASILLLAACATGEPSATSNGIPGVSSVTLSGSASGEPEGTSEGDSGGDETTGEPTTGPTPTTGPAPTSDTTTDPTAVDPTTSTGDDTTTRADPCGGPCDAPPGPCHEPVGVCTAGECVYSPGAAGLACDDGDGCTQDDACDGAGGCAGAPISCDAPNASGGSCVDGACQGFVCTPPYDDCDGDMGNGCEVPVGVANQCDVNGLNPDGGCWTAYCGQSNDASATSFAGNYYCYDCANCNTPSPGMWRWCSHDTGNWFDADVGNCPANALNKVCAPP